jgi:hypothetical protein
MLGQLLTVAWRIVRHSFPGGERTLTRLDTPASAQPPTR